MLQDYQSILNANISAADAYRKVARVSDWWNPPSKGDTQKLGGCFRVDFGQTWVDFKVVEAIPSRRMVWHVTDCHLHFVKDATEWKGTRVICDLTTKNGTTTVTMTHAGLTPAMECFEACKAGWNFHVGESLFKLLTEDIGLPDHARRAAA